MREALRSTLAPQNKTTSKWLVQLQCVLAVGYTPQMCRRSKTNVASKNMAPSSQDEDIITVKRKSWLSLSVTSQKKGTIQDMDTDSGWHVLGWILETRFGNRWSENTNFFESTWQIFGVRLWSFSHVEKGLGFWKVALDEYEVLVWLQTNKMKFQCLEWHSGSLGKTVILSLLISSGHRAWRLIIQLFGMELKEDRLFCGTARTWRRATKHPALCSNWPQS